VFEERLSVATSAPNYLFPCVHYSFCGCEFCRVIVGIVRGLAILILKVTGLRSEKGQVKIAVFKSSEKWLGEQPIYSSTINVDSQTVTWRINDVPPGDYGVAVFHDENSNGKMDKNVLGIPHLDLVFILYHVSSRFHAGTVDV
jgi:Uncharacterized protein conserved in bacteria (DUF2141)